MDINKASKEELINELKKLTHLNESNIQEIKRMEQNLVNVNKKLEEADALKSHFISNICNELVNPFTSVLALAESILNVDKENWKRVISMVALIHSEVAHLDFQLQNIFAAAKLEAGELTPEISTVDINNLILNVIETFKYDARHKSVKVHFHYEGNEKETTIYFNTDPEKVRLIIANLLSNAIKFSFKNREINIKATKAFNKLILEVEDHGQGISIENEKIIFDRFKRGDSGINSVNRGHGLGLSVNKAVLDILEGTISFSSKENEGATFLVTIPESKEVSSGLSTDANELFFNEETF